MEGITGNFLDHKKQYLIGVGVFLVVILLITVVISGKKTTSTTTNNPSLNGDINEGAINRSHSSPQSSNPDLVSDKAKTVVQTIKIPKKYRNIPVDQALYEQAYTKYSSQKPEEVTPLIQDEISKYFIFRDVLMENEVVVPPLLQKVTYDTIHLQMHTLNQLVEDNLISKADFAYINGEFNEVNSQQAVKGILDEYRSKFDGSIVNIQQIVTEANADSRLAPYNLINRNDFVHNYSGDQYFFDDPDFYKLLFSLPVGKISPLELIKGKSGKQAYMIIYPTKFTLKKYFTKDQIIKEKSQLFTY